MFPKVISTSLSAKMKQPLDLFVGFKDVRLYNAWAVAVAYDCHGNSVYETENTGTANEREYTRK